MADGIDRILEAITQLRVDLIARMDRLQAGMDSMGEHLTLGHVRDVKEQDLRIEVMATALEYIRAKVEKMERDAEDGRRKAATETERWRESMKWETRKFVLACAVAAVALVGAGVGLARLIGYHG